MDPEAVDNQEIHREATETTTKDNPVFVKYINHSNTVTAIGGTYSNGTNTIKVNISQWIGNMVSFNSKKSGKKQKIDLEEYQVLYEEGEELNRVTWIKNEIYYTVTSPSDEVSMDELIKVAKEIINLNKEI